MGRQEYLYSEKCFLSLSKFQTSDTQHPDNIFIRYLSYTSIVILHSMTISFSLNLNEIRKYFIQNVLLNFISI